MGSAGNGIQCKEPENQSRMTRITMLHELPSGDCSGDHDLSTGWVRGDIFVNIRLHVQLQILSAEKIVHPVGGRMLVESG